MKLLNILLLICCGAVAAFAGPNSSATISIDMVPSTETVQQAFTDFDTGRQFSCAVYAQNVVSLNAFSVRLALDTTKVAFVSAVLSDAVRTNILADGAPQSGVVNGRTVVEFFASAGTAFQASAPSGMLGIFTLKSRLRQSDSVVIGFSDVTLSCGDGLGEDLFSAPNSHLVGGTYHTPVIATGTASPMPKNVENHPIHVRINNALLSIDYGSRNFENEQPLLVSLYGIDGKLFMRQTVPQGLSCQNILLNTCAPPGALVCTISSGGRVLWSSLLAGLPIQ